MTKEFLSELLGTAFLLVVVVGSGIMGDTLSGGNEAIALLANSIATGLGLFVLIQNLGPISGAHLNPIVTLTEMLWGKIHRKKLLVYWAAQFIGAIGGVFIAHFMFDQEIFQISDKDRTTIPFVFSEMIATFGLISTIALAGRKFVESAPMTIAAYIAGAYWFTSSTSFANPAVSVARMLTDTFCGIAPSGVMPFIFAQAIGATTAFLLIRKL